VYPRSKNPGYAYEWGEQQGNVIVINCSPTYM